MGPQRPLVGSGTGTFVNGVVFDITQGFVYGHLANKQPHNCYLDAIGTKGVARMRHDFAEATIELYGVRNTICKTAAFKDKKLDVMVDVFGRSILAGKNLGFPQARDSLIASQLSWAMLNDAISIFHPCVARRRKCSRFSSTAAIW